MRSSRVAALGVVALLAGAGAGVLASGALGTKLSDPNTIVLNRSIGAVVLGETRAQVEAEYGSPQRTLVVAGPDGTDALLAYYETHNGTLYVTYANGVVVSVETNSPYYRTQGGVGVGTPFEDIPAGFTGDPCGLGAWNGEGAAQFTMFTRDGAEISSVLITLTPFFATCAGEGPDGPPPVVPPPPPGPFALWVAAVPNGHGYVQSNVPGIDCPTECAVLYPAGAAITLTPHPSTGAEFDRWSGDCTGSGPCTVTMNGARNVTAHFKGQAYDPTPPPETTEDEDGGGNDEESD